MPRIIPYVVCRVRTTRKRTAVAAAVAAVLLLVVEKILKVELVHTYKTYGSYWSNAFGDWDPLAPGPIALPLLLLYAIRTAVVYGSVLVQLLPFLTAVTGAVHAYMHIIHTHISLAGTEHPTSKCTRVCVCSVRYAHHAG